MTHLRHLICLSWYSSGWFHRRDQLNATCLLLAEAVRKARKRADGLLPHSQFMTSDLPIILVMEKLRKLPIVVHKSFSMLWNCCLSVRTALVKGSHIAWHLLHPKYVAPRRLPLSRSKTCKTCFCSKSQTPAVFLFRCTMYTYYRILPNLADGSSLVYIFLCPIQAWLVQ